MNKLDIWEQRIEEKRVEKMAFDWMVKKPQVSSTQNLNAGVPAKGEDEQKNDGSAAQ